MTRSLPPLLALCAALSLPGLAAAESAAALPPGMERAELLGGWQTDSGNRMAALRIALDDGWKTYWRTPGDAGIPPQFDFAGSQNVADVIFHWPTPQVFDLNGTRSVGYDDELILPLEVVPADPTQPVTLSAGVDLGICNDICVPVSVALAADLVGPGAPDPLIRAALTEQPKPLDLHARCLIEPIADGMRVTAAIALPAGTGPEVALFELPSTPVWISEAVSRRDGGVLTAMAEFVPDDARPFDLDPTDVRITVLNGKGASEIRGCVN